MAMILRNVHTKLGAVLPHTWQVAQEITGLWRLYFVWGIGPTGEHRQGRALDFMTYDDGTVAEPGPRRDKIGQAIADYLVVNHHRLGVWYVIWKRRIWSINYPASGWRRYDGTNPHIDHVHVSFINDPPAYVPSGNEDDMANADDVLAAIGELSEDEAARYKALLKNVQQEDPRWAQLKVDLARLEAKLDALTTAPPP